MLRQRRAAVQVQRIAVQAKGRTAGVLRKQGPAAPQAKRAAHGRRQAYRKNKRQRTRRARKRPFHRRRQARSVRAGPTRCLRGARKAALAGRRGCLCPAALRLGHRRTGALRCRRRLHLCAACALRAGCGRRPRPALRSGLYARGRRGIQHQPSPALHIILHPGMGCIIRHLRRTVLHRAHIA